MKTNNSLEWCDKSAAAFSVDIVIVVDICMLMISSVIILSHQASDMHSISTLTVESTAMEFPMTMTV